MMEEGHSSLSDIRAHLQKFPFDMTLQDAHLVGKYMIESDTENNVVNESSI